MAAGDAAPHKPVHHLIQFSTVRWVQHDANDKRRSFLAHAGERPFHSSLATSLSAASQRSLLSADSPWLMAASLHARTQQGDTSVHTQGPPGAVTTAETQSGAHGHEATAATPRHICHPEGQGEQPARKARLHRGVRIPRDGEQLLEVRGLQTAAGLAVRHEPLAHELQNAWRSNAERVLRQQPKGIKRRLDRASNASQQTRNIARPRTTSEASAGTESERTPAACSESSNGICRTTSRYLRTHNTSMIKMCSRTSERRKGRMHQRKLAEQHAGRGKQKRNARRRQSSGTHCRQAVRRSAATEGSCAGMALAGLSVTARST